MGLILLIETSTKNCSVAVASNDTILASKEDVGDGYLHAEKLLLFIDEVMQISNCQCDQLQAIAVSEGPGSYTGLRIGVSTAKGLAYAHSTPLIAINTLQALAWHARNLFPTHDRFCPMLDARRNEVFMAEFDAELKPISPVKALVLDDENVAALNSQAPIFIGDGAFKCKQYFPDHSTIVEVLPSATMMTHLALHKLNEKKFVDIAYFEPFYLKDFIPGVAKKVLF